MLDWAKELSCFYPVFGFWPSALVLVVAGCWIIQVGRGAFASNGAFFFLLAPDPPTREKAKSHKNQNPSNSHKDPPSHSISQKNRTAVDVEQIYFNIRRVAPVLSTIALFACGVTWVFATKNCVPKGEHPPGPRWISKHTCHLDWGGGGYLKGPIFFPGISLPWIFRWGSSFLPKICASPHPCSSLVDDSLASILTVPNQEQH